MVRFCRCSLPLWIACCFTLLACSDLKAIGIAYDDFSGYTAGDIDGQGQGYGFAGAWSDPSGTYTATTSGGLSYPGVPSGGFVQYSASNNWYSAVRNLSTPMSSGTYYFGVLTNFLNFDWRSRSDAYISGDQGDLRFGQWDFSGNLNMTYTQYPSYSSVSTTTSDPVYTGEPQYLVAKIQLDPGGDDTATFYVNPSPGPEPTSNQGVITSVDLGTLSTVGFVGAQWPGSSSVAEYGGIRIGTSYSDMFATAPEPSTLALLGVGAVGLLACAWRRRRQAA